MIYRAFKFTELASSYQWNLPASSKPSETQKIYYTNYDTLAYADSGTVASYSIDEDYMVNNNSTVTIAKKTQAVPGEIIALIKDMDAYALGVITAVDNEKLQITFKPLTYLLDVDILNPTRASETTDEDTGETSEITYYYDAVDDTARILASVFCGQTTDRFLRLPIMFGTVGGGYTDDTLTDYNAPALWNYSDDTINVADWIKDLFDNQNIVLQFGLVFETDRNYIQCDVVYNTTGGRVLKNNVSGMTITHTDDNSAKATVCHVLDKDSRENLSTFYLLSDNTVTTNSLDTTRVQPYKVTTGEVDTDEVTASELAHMCIVAAQNALLYSDLNHYISIEMYKDSKMFPTGMQIGDSVTIVPEIFENDEETDINEDYSDDVWESIYTGRKEKSSSTLVTLIFGKIRINYTDLVQMRYTKKAGR